MPNNAGVNRVFLVGSVEKEPVWEVIKGERALCFRLKTTEEIKKGDNTLEHFEWHNLKLPLEMMKGGMDIRQGDILYAQGKIQTRAIYENNVKLYRCEILVTNIEHVKISSEHLVII
ncbi:MAG TPA: single-stranded DNA-binding protein [Mucilaginibacter sp.]|jgi:single-stranded DNA-binding protein|nr:single-stranded DNA-binding protein [Mucilaginibacter sp.]